MRLSAVVSCDSWTPKRPSTSDLRSPCCSMLGCAARRVRPRGVPLDSRGGDTGGVPILHESW